MDDNNEISFNGERLVGIHSKGIIIIADDKGQEEGGTAPLQYPPPFNYDPTSNIPPVYYPPASLYSLWSYNYHHWPQQLYTAGTGAVQHISRDGTTSSEIANKSDENLCGGSREDARESCEIADSPCDAEKDNVNVLDMPSGSKTSERQLSLSTLQRDYSSSPSSSDTTTPTANSPTHHHDNSSTTSSPLTFEQQVMQFTSKRAKMLKNTKAQPLSLPPDIRHTGNQPIEMICLW